MKISHIIEAAPQNHAQIMVISRLDRAMKSGPVPEALRRLQMAKLGSEYLYEKDLSGNVLLQFYSNELSLVFDKQQDSDLYIIGHKLGLTDEEFMQFFQKMQFHQGNIHSFTTKTIPYDDACLASLRPWLGAISAALVSKNERVISMVSRTFNGEKFQLFMEVAPSAEEIIAKRADMQIANLKRNPSAIPSWFANIDYDSFLSHRVEFIWPVDKHYYLKIFLLSPNITHLHSMQNNAYIQHTGHIYIGDLLKLLHKIFDLPPNTISDLKPTKSYASGEWKSKQLADIIRTGLGSALVNAMLYSRSMQEKYSKQIKQLAAK
jgi:hypothetical protein